jgi:hypothetical protein
LKWCFFWSESLRAFALAGQNAGALGADVSLEVDSWSRAARADSLRPYSCVENTTSEIVQQAGSQPGSAQCSVLSAQRSSFTSISDKITRTVLANGARDMLRHKRRKYKQMVYKV